MRDQESHIDGATMQRYLRAGHCERSKATWAMLSALHRGFKGAARRLTGGNQLGDGTACTG